MLQIAESIDSGEQEAKGGDGHEELGDAVQAQGNGQAFRHGEEHQLPLRQEQGVGGQHRFQDQGQDHAAVLVLLLFQKGQNQSRQRGQ